MNAWHEPPLQEFDSAQDELVVRSAKALEAGRVIWDLEAPEVGEKSNDTWENLQGLLGLYVKEYGLSEPWVQLGGELGFCLPIPGSSLEYGGSIDAYLEWPSYGLFPREDKSTGAYIAKTYLAGWNHASQVTGYYWGLRQILEKEPFGVLMNMVSKKPRKEPEKRLARTLEKRSEWQVDIFMNETIEAADAIRRQWDPGQWTWPKYGERLSYECAGGPGKSACMYRRLCMIEMQPWELPEDYQFEEGLGWRKEAWEPWERRGEG